MGSAAVRCVRCVETCCVRRVQRLCEGCDHSCHHAVPHHAHNCVMCGLFLYRRVISVLTITRRAVSCVVEDCGEEPLWACESALLEHSSCALRTTEGFPIFREVTAGVVREIPNLD